MSLEKRQTDDMVMETDPVPEIMYSVQNTKMTAKDQRPETQRYYIQEVIERCGQILGMSSIKIYP
jgi:hypothetical protein